MAGKVNSGSAPFTGPRLLLASISIALLSVFLYPYLPASLDSLLSVFFFPDDAYSPSIHDASRNLTYLGALGTSHHVEHYHNIFYGQDTSGQRRFALPVPPRPAASGSIIDATREGAWCPQFTGVVLPFTSVVTNVSENCLSLRVARAAPASYSSAAAATKLPVIVWFHGGGHGLGSGSDVLYTPDGLLEQAAIDGSPVIWVSINSRVGIFGFADQAALRDEVGGEDGRGGINANMGLHDQRLALKWVRESIAAFGGDPDNVMALAHSTGAVAVALHMLAYGGAMGAPFHKAFVLSGASGLNFNTKSADVRARTARVAEVLDCVRGGDAGSAATLACLRETPLERLMNVSVSLMQAEHPPFGEGIYYPTYDGDMIPDVPSNLLRSGKFARGIPLIASYATNDGAWYAPSSLESDKDVITTFARRMHNLSPKSIKKLMELYSQEEFEHMVTPEQRGKSMSAQYYRAAQMNRDLLFVCPVIDFAFWNDRHNSQHDRSSGSRESGSPPDNSRPGTWIQQINQTRFGPVWAKRGKPEYRVSHLSDIPFMLNQAHVAGGAVNGDAAHEELALVASRALVRFAYTGSPEADAGRDLQQAGESTPTRTHWPTAFGDERADGKITSDDAPGSMTMQVFGGEHGSGPAVVRKKGATLSSERDKAVAWERLLERCGFINSRAVQAETGV